MADDPTDVAQKGMDELFKGSNVLGNPTELRLTGTGAMPGGGAAAAIPAPSGPGGVGGGFLGGTRGQQGAGPGGSGSSLALAMAMKGLGLEEGRVGGGMPTQGGPTGGAESLVGGGPMPTQAGDSGPTTAPEGAESMPFTQAAGGLDFFKTPEGLAALGELGINTDDLSALGGTNWMGTAGGALSGGLGALKGIAGVQSGDPAQAAGGALQGAGGITKLLESNPALAEALGLSGGALSGIGAGIGGLGGVLGLAQGIQSGDPVQTGTGALGAVQGASTLSGALGGPTIASGLAAAAPETTAATLSALTGSTVAATSEGIAAGLSAAAAAYALPVAAVIQMITDTIAEGERERIQNAGFYNNPIKGALYSGATQGVGSVNDMLKNMGGDLSGKSTAELEQALESGVNNMAPYYQTAQGGRGAIRASDTITGAGTDWSAKPFTGGQTPDQYTQNAEAAKSGMGDMVNELLKRGLTYEQIGQLPASDMWAMQSLDAGNMPYQMLPGALAAHPEYAAEAQGLMSKYGISPQYLAGYQSGEGGSGPVYGNRTNDEMQQALLSQVLGASQLDPKSNAGGLASSMYGGPMWQAMARMGAGGPEIQSMIAQHFDPWATARTPELLAAYGNPQEPTQAAAQPAKSPAAQKQQQQQTAQRTATAQNALGQGQGSFDEMFSDEQKREMGLI